MKFWGFTTPPLLSLPYMIKIIHIKQSVLPSFLPSAKRCNLEILTPNCPNKTLHGNSPYCYHLMKIDLAH